MLTHAGMYLPIDPSPQKPGCWPEVSHRRQPPSGLFHDLGELRYPVPVHLQPVRPRTRQYPLLSLILWVAGLQGELNAITGSCQAPVRERHSLRYLSDFLVPSLCFRG